MIFYEPIAYGVLKLDEGWTPATQGGNIQGMVRAPRSTCSLDNTTCVKVFGFGGSTLGVGWMIANEAICHTVVLHYCVVPY